MDCCQACRPGRIYEAGLRGEGGQTKFPLKSRRKCCSSIVMATFIFLGFVSVSLASTLPGLGLGKCKFEKQAAFAGPMPGLHGGRPRIVGITASHTVCSSSLFSSSRLFALQTLGRRTGAITEGLAMKVHRNARNNFHKDAKSTSLRSVSKQTVQGLRWAVSPREVHDFDDHAIETQNNVISSRKSKEGRPISCLQQTRGTETSPRHSRTKLQSGPHSQQISEKITSDGRMEGDSIPPVRERSPSPQGRQGRIGSRGSTHFNTRMSTILAGNFSSSAGQISMPYNLTLYKSVNNLMDLLEPFVEGEPGYQMTGSDAVGAMNRIKRLSGKSLDIADRHRVDRQMTVLASHVLEGMQTLNGKQVGLAVNAACGQGKAFLPLMRAAARRAEALSASEDLSSLDVQAVCMTLNGFAKSYMRDDALFNALSQYIKRGATNEDFRLQFNAQAVSVIVNAYVKLGLKDRELFDLMSQMSQSIPADLYTSQAVANILNAFARHEIVDKELFSYLSNVAQKIKPGMYMSQHIAIIVNAFAKCELQDHKLFAFFSKEVQTRDHRAFDFQAIANILNAYARNYGAEADPSLCQHIQTIVRKIPAKAYDAQNVASILNSVVKANRTDVSFFHHMAHVCMEVDPLLFDGQALSNIVHSFAKADIKDARLFHHMSGIARSMEFMFEAQSVALILNSYAKMELRDEQLMQHMSRVAQRLDPASFRCQHIENILNAFARLDVKDAPLFRHLAKVAMDIPPEQFDAQAVAITLNAFAKILPHDLVTFQICDFFSKKVLRSMPMELFNPTAISIILNAFAKVEIRDKLVFQTLGRAIRVIDMDTFDAHNIANMYHAYATLNIQDQTTLDMLARRLVSLDVKELQPEEVAIIAWSAAVLNVQDVRLIDFIIQGLDVHINSMETNFLRQAHQFLLACELDGRLDVYGDQQEVDYVRIRSRSTPQQVTEYLGKDFETCRDAFCSMSPEGFKKSKLQGEVAEVLADMGMKFDEEFVDPRSGYSLDLVLLDDLTGERGATAIEVDGPSHYAAGTRVRLGRTVMKHRHIKQLGFDLKTLPYWEWDALRTKDEKVRYLQRLLQPTPTPTLSA